MNSSTHQIILEELEARIAPASAVFTDVDGDKITIAISKAKTSGDVTAAVTGGANSVISKIDLTNFAGTNIKVSVTERGTTGDGLANVWFIDATGRDLGNVEVVGDLAKLVAGDTTYANGSVKSVKVQSIGVNGGASDKVWAMQGSTSSFSVAGSVNGATLAWSNPDPSGKLSVGSIVIAGDLNGGTMANTGSVILSAAGIAELKSISVGGSLNGSDYSQTGSIIMTGNGTMGKVSVGGSLNGDNDKSTTGAIFSSAKLGSVSVGGSLDGGGEYSGSIFAGEKITGNVLVAGSLKGGASDRSGAIFANDGIEKSVRVGGFLLGNAGPYSGSIASPSGSLGDVTIGSYLVGGSANKSGSIFGKTGVGNVFVGGTVVGGGAADSGVIATDTDPGHNIGDVTIQGDLSAGSAANTGNIAAFSAGKVSVGGSLIGGPEPTSGQVYLNGLVKSVQIGGNLQGGAGGSSGAVILSSNLAKLSSLTIGGSMIGGSGAVSAGVTVSGSVGKVVIGGGIEGGGRCQLGSTESLHSQLSRGGCRNESFLRGLSYRGIGHWLRKRLCFQSRHSRVSKQCERGGRGQQRDHYDLQLREGYHHPRKPGRRDRRRYRQPHRCRPHWQADHWR